MPRSAFVVLAVPCCLLALAAPAAAFEDPSPKGGAVAERADKDVRSGRSVVVPATRRSARSRVAGTVRTDPRTGGIAQFVRTDGFLTAPSAADPAAIALDFVAGNAAAFGLDADDRAALDLQARDVSPDGVTHLRWSQTTDGLPSLDTGIEAHVTRDGRLISVQGSAQPDLDLATTTPAVTAGEALGTARRDSGGSGVAPAAGTPAATRARSTRFATGEAASLVAFPQGDSARLAWRVLVDGGDPVTYMTVVDAATGDVLSRRSLTDFATGGDLFSRYPGASAGGSATTLPLDADPAWLNSSVGGTRLAGANTHTYADLDNSNSATSNENAASAGGNWLFPQVAFPGASPCPPAGCTYDSTDDATAETNRRQTTTNLFFHVNTFHDYLRDSVIGFDVASGNFEGNDRVIAEANDGASLAPVFTGNGVNRNNANFSTPPDGSNGVMQQYLFTTRDVNSSDDASIIYHEYTHGLSNRLVVDSSGFGALGSEQSGAMGEAWSDFYGMDFLAHRGLVTDTAAPGDILVGDYVIGGIGIRPQALDCEVDQVAPPACPSGGFTYQDVRTLAVPHGMGNMWAQTLWDIRRAIARTDGTPALSDAEHDQVLLLVTGGMRLSPDFPNYLEMRDAILQQAGVMALTGRDHRPLLQVLFARRGMGADASSASDLRAAATEGFELPDGVGSLRGDATTFDDSFAAGGDGDGVVEAGETVAVTSAVRNIGKGAVAGATGIPEATAEGFTVSGGPVAFPTVATGGTPVAGSSYRLTVSADRTCGGTALDAAGLVVNSPVGGPTVFASPILGPAIAEPADPSVGPGETVDLAIPDGPAPGISQDIVVPAGSGLTIGDLNLKLDVTHTWVNDLTVLLTHVDTGTSALLVNRAGADDAENITGLVLDDEAAGTLAAAAAPFTGRFRPAGALSAFDGESLAGTWRLTLQDFVTQDTGTLRGWNLNASAPTDCPVTRPVATTGDATDVTTSAARIAGTAGTGPGSITTEYRFVHGTTTSYGSATPTAAAPNGAGGAQTVELTGLQPNTTYHYRVETLRGGTLAVAGADRTFTTASVPVEATPTPTPTSSGPGAPAATPTPAPGLQPAPTPGPGTPGSTDPGLTAGIRFTGTPKRITLSSKGTFGLRFGATGGTRGTLTIKATVPGKRNAKTRKRARSKVVTLVNAKAFTADAKGNVAFKSVASSKAGFAKLTRTTKTFAAVLEVKVGTKTFTHRFTFQRAKRKR